jgi:hypothetical protein
MRHWVFGIAGALVGAGAYGATATLIKPPASHPVPVASAEPLCREEQSLREANGNLTASLHECDRKLAELGAAREPIPAPTASAAAQRDAGRDRFRSRGEPSKEEWERMAKLGMVRARFPCIRDKPWTPNPRQIDRMGIAPQDAQAIREAYEKSNKRLSDTIKPLCAKAVGSPELADKLGSSTCIDAIHDMARKSDPEGTKQALTRVAELNAGSRTAPAKPADAPAVEQLALALSGESKKFEDDLAQKLGPEEARRLASSPELCSDRRFLRTTDEPADPGQH